MSRVNDLRIFPIFIVAVLLILAVPALADSKQAGSTTEHRAQTEATRAVALPFLRSLFAEGNLHGAYEQYAAPDFIQHNPEMGDGIEARRRFFDEKAKKAQGEPGQWANVTNMIIVDGDLFAVHHHALAGPDDPGRVFVDIWRVADGRIVEHWDVIQDIPLDQPHDNGIACGKGDDFESAQSLGDTVEQPTCGWPDNQVTREASLKVVSNYVSEMVSGDVRSAITRWFAPDYKQHSPIMADGIEGAISHLEEMFGGQPDELPRELGSRAIAEGDLVLFHRLVQDPDKERPVATVDIFRVTDGKISEHWDIKQQAPAQAANDNGIW